MPSYHDLYITTKNIPRTAIFNLPYNIEVCCCRVAGWQVWPKDDKNYSSSDDMLLGGEYDYLGLILDVNGHVIVDSLTGKSDAKD
jgi:hypothetical protein